MVAGGTEEYWNYSSLDPAWRRLLRWRGDCLGVRPGERSVTHKAAIVKLLLPLSCSTLSQYYNSSKLANFKMHFKVSHQPRRVNFNILSILLKINISVLWHNKTKHTFTKIIQDTSIQMCEMSIIMPVWCNVLCSAFPKKNFLSRTTYTRVTTLHSVHMLRNITGLSDVGQCIREYSLSFWRVASGIQSRSMSPLFWVPISTAGRLGLDKRFFYNNRRFM